MARYGGDEAVCYYCGGRQFTSAGALRQHLIRMHPYDGERGGHFGPEFELDQDGYWRQVTSSERGERSNNRA